MITFRHAAPALPRFSLAVVRDSTDIVINQVQRVDGFAGARDKGRARRSDVPQFLVAYVTVHLLQARLGRSSEISRMLTFIRLHWACAADALLSPNWVSARAQCQQLLWANAHSS